MTIMRKLFAFLAVIGMGVALAASPASAAKPGGGATSASCPNGSANLPTDNDVRASAVTNGNVTTYKLHSNDQNSAAECRAWSSTASTQPAHPQRPRSTSRCARLIASTKQEAPYNLSFGRPGGNATNVPFDEDNETTTIGTATWNGTVPNSQNIVLHVADPSLCGTSPTCFVKPGPRAVCDAGAGDSTFGYNNLPRDFARCAPPPSFGFEAHPGTSEFGNGVSVSGGSNIESLTVDFQSYGCGDSGHWNTEDCVTTQGRPSHPR